MHDQSIINDFLQSLSATIDDRDHCLLSGSELEPCENLISPLTHYGFLVTEGPDSANFLQGQTTCDLSNITVDQSLPGAYCNPKGRMVSSFHTACLAQDSYLIRMRRELVTSSCQAFSKYIVFSKAEQRDSSGDYLAIGLHGVAARKAIKASFGALPTDQNQQVVSDGSLAIQLDEEGLLYECWVKATQLTAMWPTLSDGLNLQGSRSWELLCIRRGQGEICAATVDLFIPQMLNYHTTGAVSFTKGCYTGQEVVARMQYKATMKRQMYRIAISSPDILPADALYRPDSEQSIGNVVNVIPLDSERTEALAVITIKDVDANQLVAGENGVAVEVLSLPYAINN